MPGSVTPSLRGKPYGLDLLAFELPEFTRVTWTSDRAREVWEPRCRRVFEAWMKIEPLAVVAGIRRCSLSLAAAEALPAVAGENARRGLSTLPVAIQGLPLYSYANAATSPVLGQPFMYRVVVGGPADISAFQEAWDACDQERIGELLGYPSCCRAFFHRVWVEDGLRDTTWPMAFGTLQPDAATPLLEVAGPPEANILGRWFGVRAVSHLPCRFDCEETVRLARSLIALGRESGFGEEMDWLLEILDWPAEWSALHGIAEVKTPVLKVTTSTDATASKFVVRRRGRSFPAEGAEGLSFAFRPPARRRVTESNRFRKGLDHPLPVVESTPDDERNDG